MIETMTKLELDFTVDKVAGIKRLFKGKRLGDKGNVKNWGS